MAPFCRKVQRDIVANFFSKIRQKAVHFWVGIFSKVTLITILKGYFMVGGFKLRESGTGCN